MFFEKHLKRFFVFALLITSAVLCSGEVKFGNFTSNSPCFFLGFGKKASIPGTEFIMGKVVDHNAEKTFILKNELYLRKKGHQKHKAKLQWLLPDNFPAGKYKVYTLFTLGGISTQQFIFSSGPDTEHLNFLGKFSQKNPKSWKASWQKGRISLGITSEDKILQIGINGFGSLQKIIKGFILEKVDNSQHDKQ